MIGVSRDRSVDAQGVLLRLRHEQTDVAAPGGDACDTPDGTPQTIARTASSPPTR